MRTSSTAKIITTNVVSLALNRLGKFPPHTSPTVRSSPDDVPDSSDTAFSSSGLSGNASGSLTMLSVFVATPRNSYSDVSILRIVQH